MTTRPYSSPLRERQAEQTRELLLDSFTELLETRRADEVTTRDLARAAGVSERTVYRHFADREALQVGLSQRLARGGVPPNASMHTVDDLPAAAAYLLPFLDEFHVEARAEALLNADPRRFAPETRATSEQLRALLADEFSDLDESEIGRVTALIRCLLSAQAWLRMREEFDVPGTESGPVVAWALSTIIDALRRGDRPSEYEATPLRLEAE